MNGPGFDDFYRDEYGPIVRVVYLIVGDRDLATDVAQDAFTQAFRNWSKIAKYDRPGAWVRRVAIRQATSARTRRDARPSAEALAAGNGVVPAPDDVTALADEVRRAMVSLTPKQRAVIALTYYDGASNDDVADLLGCSSTTVRVHLHKARATLSTLLTNPTPTTGVADR